MAYLILWEFRPRPGKEPELETAYGPGGDWARLFRRSGEYLGTHLLRDVGDPCRYFTLDRWTSRGAFEDFRRFHRSDYLELDRRCERLTEHEAHLGAFETL